MRKVLAILLLLIPGLTRNLNPLVAQDFIGCREGDNWAETPMLRKTFSIKKLEEGSVWARVASLGYHELYINQTKVGDEVMQPAVSRLDKYACLVGYDMTDYLHEGENEIMLWLGQGWGRVYGTPAVARVGIYRFDEDGIPGFDFLTTDSTWEASPSGYSYTDSWQPMHFGGERYDARVKPDWRPASVYKADDIIVSSQNFWGNRIVDFLSPISETPQPDGSILLDFGRVVMGWFQAQMLPIPEGDEVTMEYLDHLDAKPPFTETDIYVSDGTGDDDMHFTNRFHMHAFRYVRIRGLEHYVLDSTLGIPAVIGSAVQISAVDPKKSATFECSDSRLNAIHDMVKYTLSCLTFSGYMVDCPHIERMGYGGDGNSSTMTLQTLWDVSDIYRHWLAVWDREQISAVNPGWDFDEEMEGDLPYVAPAFRTGGGPYWSGFIIKAPWRVWLNYGTNIFYLHYNEMDRWLGFVERHCEDGILKPWPDTERRAWFLGDWAVPEGVDKDGESVLHVNNCFLAECLADMVQMAYLMGRNNDAERFAAWRESLVKDIHRHFYHPEPHTYANGTVLDQCYALLQGIPPDSATAQAVKEQLLKDIHGKYRDHIAVGLMGVPIFTEWCIRERQADLMATLLRQEDYPGYLHMINNGATTTWESWDCGRPGKEDRSRVHNCYNGIGIWFYQALAGIRPDPEQPGYKHFFVDPQSCEGVDWVKCTKPTPYGNIKVVIESGKLKVEIPAGTTATVFPNTPDERLLQAGDWTIEIH